MAKAFLSTDIGFWTIEADDQNVLSIAYSEEKPEFPQDNTPILATAKKQLEEYFDGRRKNFDLPVALSDHSAFYNRVWKIVSRIPYGKMISYSDIALELGDIKSVRAVGMANSKNPLPIIIPCHRVIGKNKELTGYAYGLKVKRCLLEKEGALIVQGSLF
jgi:methylated-DNA-[protein]-cysteine S-methyltransferase